MRMEPVQKHPAMADGYLLIEPATISYTPILRSIPSVPCVPRVLAHREELMPRLIDLTAVEPDTRALLTDLWHEELDTDRPPVACAWIDSASGIDDLAAHLARYLVGPGTDGNPVFWRFYDPRVFSLTLAVFEKSQRDTLLGPVRNWQFPWAGHQWAVAGSGLPAETLEGRAPGWPRSDQWLRIDRSEIVTRVLGRLAPVQMDDAYHLPAALDRILTDVSTRGGLTSMDDQIDYAWHCVRYGSGFEQHPKLVNAWAALVSRETGWNDVKGLLTPADFKALEQSVSSPRM